MGVDHIRALISAFSTSVSRRCMDILHDKRPARCRAAEHGDERATLHSITSSALASNVGDIVRPSAWAVFVFNTTWNFVGCSTGRMAGFAPLMILSTYGAARSAGSCGGQAEVLHEGPAKRICGRGRCENSDPGEARNEIAKELQASAANLRIHCR